MTVIPVLLEFELVVPIVEAQDVNTNNKLISPFIFIIHVIKILSIIYLFGGSQSITVPSQSGAFGQQPNYQI
jgi:hypothetical protein